MRKISICAAVVGAVMGMSSFTAEAMPLPNPTVNRVSDVQQVAKVVVRYGYYRGHRGYRYRRPGYRFYGGFWYPAAAFAPVIVVKPRGNWRWCGPRWHRYRCRY